MITVEHLTKRYGSVTAVDDISFTLETGHIYGFLGPNGAGKSTTMNIMTGCLAASAGEVTIDGHDIFEDARQAKRLIGYLPEIPPLYTDETPWEYLCFVAQAKGIPAKQIPDEVARVVAETRLDEMAGRLIRNLSKGYRQRVGIAQALLGSPPYIILDEPTVGLDPKQIIEIRTLIRSLAKEHTIILSSHILSEIQEVCDHILIIHKGKMVASGTPVELEEQLAGPSTLELTVRGEQKPLKAALELLDGVTAVEPRPAGEDGAAKVQISYSKDVRESVFDTCVQNHLPILELRRSGLTLEEIFLKLTSEDVQEDAPEDQSAQAQDAPEEPAAKEEDQSAMEYVIDESELDPNGPGDDGKKHEGNEVIGG